MQTILVIDDDELVARTVQRMLKLSEYQVVVAHSGAEGLQMARRHLPGMVVLDIVMPGADGFQVCRQLRGDPLLKDVPILFLSALGGDNDRIEGFRAGGDDYLTKPFNLMELQLRVQAILRRLDNHRPAPETSGLIQVGDVRLDTRNFSVTTPAGTSLLTNVQFDLLYHLMSNAGRVFTSQQLLQDVWDYPRDTGSPELVRAHVKNLRDKLEPEPSRPVYIRTVQGHGYTFSAA
ncbi:MAG: response regulator transcription factor [Candidatus Promineifilaceae bacterium]